MGSAWFACTVISSGIEKSRAHGCEIPRFRFAPLGMTVGSAWLASAVISRPALSLAKGNGAQRSETSMNVLGFGYWEKRNSVLDYSLCGTQSPGWIGNSRTGVYAERFAGREFIRGLFQGKTKH